MDLPAIILNKVIMISIKREDNGNKGRFAIYENDEFAGEMTYTSAGNGIFIIDHTTVEEGHNGKGFGRKLLIKAVDFARENNLKIIPLCSYAKSVFDKDPGIEDVLHK